MSWNAIAAFFGQQRARPRILEAENVDDGQSHHAGHVVAVVVQLVESLDAARLQIGADAVDHVVEILMRECL